MEQNKVFYLPTMGKPIDKQIFKTKNWTSLMLQVKRPLLQNPLIDDYGRNNPQSSGENGISVVIDAKLVDKVMEKQLFEQYKINVMVSDMVPLNRIVPDARHKLCLSMNYDQELSKASIVVPFHNEWPSLLLRTIYSIINRTPWKYLLEIIMVDDGSNLPNLGDSLDAYISTHFPQGLVKLLRLKKRSGLIKARNEGWKLSKGDVVVFLDSHMEVNHNWLRPLLREIKQDPHVVAMAQLDYIDANTLAYTSTGHPPSRFGFDWPLNFFDLNFRPDQLKKQKTAIEPLPGAVMAGSAFAINSTYFRILGAYDEGLEIWGGENLELSFKVWMCGGRLLHVPCAHIGHVHRVVKPYTFPDGGKQITELRNYLRVAMVWMGPKYSKFFIDSHLERNMSQIEFGNVSSRVALRDHLKCHDFSWYLKTAYPELVIPNEGVRAWGGLRNNRFNMCLDTSYHVYQSVADAKSYQCSYQISNQGFMWTKVGNLIRSPLLCLIVKDSELRLQQCMWTSQSLNGWQHTRHGQVKHITTATCLDMTKKFKPIMLPCTPSARSQRWSFRNYVNHQDDRRADR